jgi:ubiquinone/menaquinone biosynthesis C-methylase UbiE
MKYTFGTSKTAAQRLEEIAKFFNPLAADLIKHHIQSRPAVAMDLGCGPGFTTDMLAEATRANEIIGLDSSKEMLSYAIARYRNYKFIEHDIANTPFPFRSNIMYCRFLLSHLLDPVSVINKWITQLNDNGMIIIEELERIKTESDLFNTYISTSDRIVKSQGASLHVGELIATGKYDAKMLLNDCSTLAVKDSQAASWFYPNTITIWRNNPVISSIHRLDKIEDISNSLKEIMNSKSNQSTITWYMRRMILYK